MDSQKISSITIDQLTFSLFERPLHPELFEIHAHRQVKTDNYEVIIWVTGCTHVVGVFSGNHSLSEVVSIPEQPLPAGGLLERFHFGDSDKHQYTQSQTIGYTMDCQTEKMTPKKYKQSRTELERLANDRGVLVKHPDCEPGCLQPFRYIDFEAKQTELHVHTFSAFPDQSAMIKTQSLFDLN
jgi:hypothetical protein